MNILHPQCFGNTFEEVRGRYLENSQALTFIQFTDSKRLNDYKALAINVNSGLATSKRLR